MTAAVADNVQATSTSTGTGSFTLAALNGRQTFATAFGTGSTTDVFYYFISSAAASEWEMGTGHLSATTTLVRDTVLNGSNGTSKVNFGAGLKYLCTDLPASIQAASFPTAPQAANRIYAGPASGSLAVPTFRALVNADFPNPISLGALTATAVTSPSITAGVGTLFDFPQANVGASAVTFGGHGLLYANASGQFWHLNDDGTRGIYVPAGSTTPKFDLGFGTTPVGTRTGTALSCQADHTIQLGRDDQVCNAFGYYLQAQSNIGGATPYETDPASIGPNITLRGGKGITAGGSVAFQAANSTAYTSTAVLSAFDGATFGGFLKPFGRTFVKTQYDMTTTTLGNVNNLTVLLRARQKYRFKACLHATVDTTGLIKVGVGTSDALTATAVVAEVKVYDNAATAVTVGRLTALGTAVDIAAGGASRYIEISGYIEVNVAGRLTVQAAEHSASGTSSILVGSTFDVDEYPATSLTVEGDSISAGDPTALLPAPYGERFWADASVSNYFSRFVNFAVSGNRVSDLAARAANVKANLVPGTTNVLTVLIGFNDYAASMSTAAFLTALAAYLDGMRTAGYTVGVCTLTPSNLAGFNTWRGTVNTELRLWTTNGVTIPGQHADFVVDFAADATMGPDAAASDASLYILDTGLAVHPTVLGQTNLKGVYATAVAAYR